MAADDPTGAPVDRNGDAVEEHPLEVLSESDCWTLLRSVDVGRLAIATPDAVEIFPINFVVDHGTIVFRTAAGTKLSRVSQTHRIGFEADHHDVDGGVAWSVVVQGDANVIEGRTDVFDVFDLDLRPWHNSTKPFFIRLVPTTVSGRRFVVTGRRS